MRFKTYAILLAAGLGKRMNDITSDKVLTQLLGKPILRYSWEAFIASRIIDVFVLVFRDKSQKINIIKTCNDLIKSTSIIWVQGGSQRQDSVLNAVKACIKNANNHTSYVHIHDAARPFITVKIIQKIHQTILVKKAAIVVRKVNETIQQVKKIKSLHGIYLKNLKRDTLWITETPQSFSLKLIYKALNLVEKKNISITDDVTALEYLKHPVSFIENKNENIKITYPKDLIYAKFISDQLYN